MLALPDAAAMPRRARSARPWSRARKWTAAPWRASATAAAYPIPEVVPVMRMVCPSRPGWAKQHVVKLAEGDRLSVFETASDTERRAARRLGVEIAQVKLSARVLWDHRDFDDERDGRIGDVDELEPRSRQARRGLVTREMLAELRTLFEEIKAGKEGNGAGER